MLEIKVNLIPLGDDSMRKELGKMTIVNVVNHPKRPEFGNYIVHHDGGNFFIKDYKRDNGFWLLVKQAIEKYINE